MLRKSLLPLAVLALLLVAALRFLPEKQGVSQRADVRPTVPLVPPATPTASELAVAPGSAADVLTPGVAKAEPFTAWTARYLAAPAPERAALVAEGVQLAAARRPIFKDLIQRDPQRALLEAVPMVVRQQLPAEVLARLEVRVANRGVVRHYWRAPEPGSSEPPVLRYAELKDGTTLRAHVYGRRAQEVRWTMDASLNGVALDGHFAVSESPIRALEVGEIPDAGKAQIEVCPISGKTTAAVASSAPVTVATPAIEAYGEIVYLCDGSHATLYEQTLIQGESSSGGAQGFTGILPSAPTPSVGVVKVLCIPAVFADQGQTPASEATMLNMLRETGDFYQASSYGKLTLVATVTPPIVLPRNQAWYKGKDTTDGFIKEIDGLGLEMTHAKEEARKLGYDWQDYHATVVRANGGARAPTSFGGGGNVWMRNDSTGTCAHEIGHAFGLAHANFWQTNGASIIGPGGNVEYGDPYDNMGGGGVPTGHYNVQAKNQVSWLPNEFAPPITASGTYRIHAFDTPQLEPGKLYGLRVVKDQNRTYWGEHRTLISGNNWVANGLLLGWKWPANAGGNLQLLDTTPGSPNDRNDAGITLGRTFSDFEAGIHITTLAVNANTSPRSVDVRVNLGQFPGNQAPSFTLATSATVVPTNSPVTFTATANDPDGDALSYGWIWHDSTISPNAAVVTRTFTTNGIYTLSCVVSDMKGGTTIRNAVITVGNGNSRFTIAGRITKEGVGVGGINVSTSGTNGTLTDSDGRYTISNLTAATYTITPAIHGFVFNELFNNSITVGPSFDGADFTVDELPVVSITAPTPLATEGGASGVFRIARTGSSALPLAVNVFAAQGTATKTTDYTFSPDYAAVTSTPWQSFTIPADAEFLDVTVAAVNDATQEGYETVTLVLGQDASFAPGASISATVGIADDDTPRPRVSLTAAPAQVDEDSGGSVVCTVTRTGSTTASLAVAYTVASTSTATPGADYTALSGTVTIPIGAASETFAITPIDDATSEVVETVRVSIVTGAAFVADTSANAIVAQIVDDDTQTVTVTMPDATATEVDLVPVGAVPDPGTILLTRSGDLSAPLTVYYSVAGTALHGTDYEALPGSVVIPAGETQAPVAVMPRLDAIGEAPETVLLTIGAGFGNYQLGATASGTVTIADSGAPPILEVTTSSNIAAEPSSNGTFRITAKGTGTGSITVKYTISGTAIAGTDYNIAGLNTTTLEGTATVTLNNGTATADIPVTVVNDALTEPLETVVITLTPDPAYVLWSESASSTLLLRDDEQPTVFADGQVGNTGAHFVSESATTTTNEFWISRTGSTTGALAVNYSMTGTATNGTDYTTLSGTATIPAGAPGIDISFTTINDSVGEGTETVILHLEPGSYAAGPDARIYITDDDTSATSVAFASAGGAGSESVTTVNIPVVLNAPAAGTVTVEYSLEAGLRSTTALSGLWLRVVKTGTSFASFLSRDGVTFTATSSARTITGFPTNYLAGFAVTSGASGTNGTFEIDEVSVTGLSVGGSAGAVTGADLAGSSPPGAHSATSGVYRLGSGGPDISTTSTTDGGRIVYFPITASANCTVTARVRGLTSTNTNVKAGAMIRESTATNARHFTYVADSTNATRQIYRTTAGGSATSSFIAAPTFAKPQYLRLQRAGDVFTASTSPDGLTFSPIGGPQTLPLSAQLLVGLAAASRVDGQFTQASFDNVSIAPAPAQPLQGRPIGFVGEPGSVSGGAGSYVITASGLGIMPALTSTEDECHFLAAPVSGDFTLTARLLSIAGGASNAQAGLMVRESANYRGRAVSFGLTGSGATATEYRARISSTTSGEGVGIDYRLAPGLLTFAPGVTTQDIVVNVTDDLLAEPSEFLNVMLRNANGATLGAPAYHTYTIVDNDAPHGTTSVGFAGAVSSVAENVSPAGIPVVLDHAVDTMVTVDYASTLTGTATSGTDFTAISGTVNFAPGETVQTIALPVLDDPDIEPAETVVLTLTNATNASLSTTSTHTLTITDDDAPIVTITATDPTATEGGDSGAFTVSRTGPTASAMTVNFARTGTAVSGTDFTAFSPTTSVTIPIGQASVDLLVAPLQETTPEVDETVIVTLAAGAGYTVGTPSAATVTIQDDDVNTITLTASDPIASEAGANPGEFTLTRTGPTTASRLVTLSITGTATGGSDYTSISTSRTFAIGQSIITIPVTALQDSATENDEVVVASIATSTSYIVGTPSVANVTIVDDDLPPTVFISSPASKATIVSTGNGLMLEAIGDDDGLPSPLTYAWTRLFGPGSAIFEDANAASTGVTFTSPGVYGLRVTVNDGQYSATDDVFVQAGGFAYASWVSIDQGPPSVRGVAGESSGVFTLIGSGTGYSGTNDSGHLLFRQLLGGTGDCTIVARLTGLTGPATRLAGLTVRDTSWKGARRVNLLLDGAGTLQFRTRATANVADTATTNASFSTPLWLRLERVGSDITAATAPDVAGAPGTWTTAGTTSAVTMGANVVVGMVVSNGASTNTSATAIFDNVTVTPAFSGPALHSEDIGNYTLPGNSSESAGVTTVNAVGTYDGSGGHFRYQQVWGDCMVTARLITQTGTNRGSQAGVGLRDTTDNGAHGFYGRTTIDGFQAHWRSSPGGSGGTLQTGGSIGSWVRVMRKGNVVTAFRAANVSGAPGPWAQVTGNLPAALTGPLLVGLVVDSNSTSLTGTGTFSGLTIEPLNTAPVVDAGTLAAMPPFTLNGTVTDDGRPNPPGAYTVAWSKLLGPGTVTFSNALIEDPLATLSLSGAYTLRLLADDGDTRTFDDLSFTGFLTPFAQWQHTNFANGLTNPLAAPDADPDFDGLVNVLEYATGTDPNASSGEGYTYDVETIGVDKFLRVTITKNPAATDVTWAVQCTSTLESSASWSSAGLIIEETTATTLRVRDNLPLGGTPRFIRASVTQP